MWQVGADCMDVCVDDLGCVLVGGWCLNDVLLTSNDDNSSGKHDDEYLFKVVDMIDVIDRWGMLDEVVIKGF